jgi:cobalt-zinc-cadmium efflux system membrane fusion protein
MQQEFQEKNNELVFLKQDFERKQTLYDKGVSSGKDFQMAQSKFRSATSTVNGLKAKMRLLGINSKKVAEGEIFSAVAITSPISGYVDQVMISLGDYVGTQSKMFSISDNSRIYINFKVYEKDISHIKKGQQIYFSTTSQRDELLKATVRSVGKSFETDPKALEVLADIENKDKNLHL